MAVTEMDMKRLGTWEREIFRRVYGPVVEEVVWRMRTTQELKELYNDLGTVANIKKRRDWNGLYM